VSMEINARLRHVRWIGGGSGAGKSAVAERLAVAHRLRIYHTEPSAKYSSRLRPEDAPLLHAFAEMDMDERWVNRPAQVMYETFHGFDGETFHLIVEDLLDLGDEAPVLAEGFVLLPRLVAPLLANQHQAVWLLPTPEFRRAAFDHRGSTWTIANKTSDPDRALANLLARDRLFTEDLRGQAAALHLPTVEVDGSLSVDELVQRVAEILRLG
jgi:hypothetical protein